MNVFSSECSLNGRPRFVEIHTSHHLMRSASFSAATLGRAGKFLRSNQVLHEGYDRVFVESKQYQSRYIIRSSRDFLEDNAANKLQRCVPGLVDSTGLLYVIHERGWVYGRSENVGRFG